MHQLKSSYKLYPQSPKPTLRRIPLIFITITTKTRQHHFNPLPKTNTSPSDLDKPLDGKTLLLCGVSDAILKRTLAKTGSGGAPADTKLGASAPSPSASGGSGGGAAAGGSCDGNAAPQAVRNLKVTENAAQGGGKAQISITWDAPTGSECVTGYEVHVANTQTTSMSKADVAAGATTGLVFKYRGDSGTPVSAGSTGADLPVHLRVCFSGCREQARPAPAEKPPPWLYVPTKCVPESRLTTPYTNNHPSPITTHRPPQYLFDVLPVNDAGTGPSRSVTARAA